MDPFTAEPSLETTASRFAAARAVLRASPLYLPPCPLCSVIGHHDTPDIIRTPHAIKGRRAGLWRIGGHACELLCDSPAFEIEEEACAWWREHRINEPLSAVGHARRALKLARLARDWEPTI